MIRQIIHIDEEKCTGCGLCAGACHEGAIGMIDGKAKLLRDDACDGMGDCLPACPAGAIRFEKREAVAYDPAVVQRMKEARAAHAHACPGAAPCPVAGGSSSLGNWPIQLKLAPLCSPVFEDCDLLVAADCTGFALNGIQQRMAGKTVLIACPKLDMTDYSEKLGEILRLNSVRSVSVLRMQVPCCGGLVMAVRRAMQAAGKQLPLHVTVVATGGQILSEE